MAGAAAAGTPQTGPDFVVNGLAATRDGACTAEPQGCTLADAIDAANAASDASIITFAPTLTSPTVTLDQALDAATGGSGLPVITTPITISGPAQVRRVGGCALDGDDDPADFRLLENRATLSLNELTLSGGCADGSGDAGRGGAIFNTGTLTISGTELTYHHAYGEGGAIFAGAGGSVVVTGSLLFSNTAMAGGGLAHGVIGTGASGSAVELRETTLTANTATADGGALFAGDGLTISGSGLTLVRNQAMNGLQVAAVGSGAVSLAASVLSLPSGGGSCAGPVTAGGDTLVTDDSCDAAVVVTPGELNLGLLKPNQGGPRSHLPGPGSVAVDRGAVGCLGEDQRGLPRAVDADGDGLGQCDLGAVEVQNTPVTAVPDNLTPGENEVLTADLFANDQDAEDEDSGVLVLRSVNGNPANVAMPIEPAQGGTLVVGADGGLVFDPGASFNALDDGDTARIDLTYRVFDGYAESTADVLLEIQGENDAPTAESSFVVTDEATPIMASLRVRDPDSGDARTVTQLTSPTEGELLVSGTTFSFDPAGDFEDLATGAFREVAFDFVVDDGDLMSDPATVTIRVEGLNDAPVAADDQLTVAPGTEVAVAAAAGLLANDVDIDGDPLMVTTTGNFMPAGIGGSLELMADGSYVYVAPSVEGSGSFGYSITDGLAFADGTLMIEVITGTDLTVSIDDGVTAVNPGQRLVYRIEVVNQGPLAVSDALVEVPVPAGLVDADWTCTPDTGAACAASGSGSIMEQVDLDAGASLVFELSATVAAQSGSVTGTAMVSHALVELTPADNEDTDTDILAGIFADGFES